MLVNKAPLTQLRLLRVYELQFLEEVVCSELADQHDSLFAGFILFLTCSCQA